MIKFKLEIGNNYLDSEEIVEAARDIRVLGYENKLEISSSGDWLDGISMFSIDNEDMEIMFSSIGDLEKAMNELSNEIILGANNDNTYYLILYNGYIE